MFHGDHIHPYGTTTCQGILPQIFTCLGKNSKSLSNRILLLSSDSTQHRRVPLDALDERERWIIAFETLRPSPMFLP